MPKFFKHYRRHAQYHVINTYNVMIKEISDGFPNFKAKYPELAKKFLHPKYKNLIDLNEGGVCNGLATEWLRVKIGVGTDINKHFYDHNDILANDSVDKIFEKANAGKIDLDKLIDFGQHIQNRWAGHSDIPSRSSQAYKKEMQAEWLTQVPLITDDKNLHSIFEKLLKPYRAFRIYSQGHVMSGYMDSTGICHIYDPNEDQYNTDEHRSVSFKAGKNQVSNIIKYCKKQLHMVDEDMESIEVLTSNLQTEQDLFPVEYRSLSNCLLKLKLLLDGELKNEAKNAKEKDDLLNKIKLIINDINIFQQAKEQPSICLNKIASNLLELQNAFDSYNIKIDNYILTSLSELDNEIKQHLKRKDLDKKVFITMIIKGIENATLEVEKDEKYKEQAQIFKKIHMQFKYLSEGDRPLDEIISKLYDLLKGLLLSKDPNLVSKFSWHFRYLSDIKKFSNIVSIKDSIIEDIKKGNITQNNDKRTNLHATVALGDFETTRKLLIDPSFQQQITLQDKIGRTILLDSLSRGHTSIAALILSYYPQLKITNIDEKNKENGCTPLHYAFSNPKLISLVPLLLQFGAINQINLRCEDRYDKKEKTKIEMEGFTPLQELLKKYAHYSKIVKDINNNNANQEDVLSQKGYSGLLYELFSQYRSYLSVEDQIEAIKTAIEFNDAQLIKLFVSGIAFSKIVMTHSSAVTELYIHAVNCRNKAAADLLVAHIDPTLEVANGKYDKTFALHACVKKSTKDTEVLERFLKIHGATINICNSYGETPLHMAVKSYNYDAINTLVKRGADVNKKDTSISNIFHMVMLNKRKGLNSAELLNVIVNATDDKNKISFLINEVNQFNKTPLQLAVENGDYNSVKLFIKHGALLNTKNSESKTSLHLAAEKGFNDIAEKLLQHDASLNEVDSNGKTPLDLAIENGHVETVKLLLNQGAISYINKNTVSENDIKTAIIVEDQQFVEKMLKDIKQQILTTNKSQSILHIAMMVNSDEKMLSSILNNLESKVKQDLLNKTDANGKSPLHIAIEKDNIKAAMVLIKEGADLTLKDNNNITPLHLAAKKGFFDVVNTILLDKNVSIDGVDGFGLTPLHYAVKSGNKKVVYQLIDQHSDANLKPKNGFTALQHAAREGHIDLARMLYTEKNAKLLDCEKFPEAADLAINLHVAIICHQPDEVGKILETKDISLLVNNLQQNILHVAALVQSNKTMIDLLFKTIKHEKLLSMLKASDMNGDYPLHLSIKSGNQYLVETLITHGANVNQANALGKTPLHIAVETDNIDLVKLLIEKGATLTAKDKQNQTALDLADNKGYQAIRDYIKLNTSFMEKALISASKKTFFAEAKQTASKVVKESIDPSNPLFKKK